MFPAVARATLGSLDVGDGLPVAVIGVLNVSPESFYAGSVHRDPSSLLRSADAMISAGADVLDVGAMSTAPYRETWITPEDEADRLAVAVAALVAKFDVLVSADTTRSAAARAAIAAGARIINDVSGLRDDPEMARVVADHAVGTILMARPPRAGGVEDVSDPVAMVARLLGDSLERATAAGLSLDLVVLDPGIGFFREATVPWHEWDATVIRRLGELRALGRPLCVGVSRKSFIGAITGEEDPARRLHGSLAATAIAVRNGAALVRTHDVAETRDAVRVASALSA